MKYGAGTIARYPYLPSSSVFSLPRHSGAVRCAYWVSYKPKGRQKTHVTCPLSGWKEGELSNFGSLLTRAVCFPCLDDGAWNGLSASGEHASLDIHVLALSLRRDRLPNRDWKMNSGKEGGTGWVLEKKWDETNDRVHPQ